MHPWSSFAPAIEPKRPARIPVAEQFPSTQAYVEDLVTFAAVLRGIVGSGTDVFFTERHPGKVRGFLAYTTLGDKPSGIATGMAALIAETAASVNCSVWNLHAFRCDVPGDKGSVRWYSVEFVLAPRLVNSRL